ncbi:MAG: hypothetical protein WBR26_27090, partial [Candidatus Acidiferrum sp.]
MIKVNGQRRSIRIENAALFCTLFLLCSALFLRADQPYAPSKDYDLQHSRIALRFDVNQKKVIGDVTHT